MELSEIDSQLAAFKKTLKPVQKGQTTIKSEEKPAKKPVEQPVETVVPAEAGKACFNPCFIRLVKSVKPEFIGDNVGDLLIELLGQLPECEPQIGVAS